MSNKRLKGDETYPECPVCKKPVRDDDNSVSISAAYGLGPSVHFDCFDGYNQLIVARTKGGNKVAKGVQTVMTDTGEIVDEPDLKVIETTVKSSKTFLIGEKELGDEFVVAVYCQVIEVGTEFVEGNVINVQKVKVRSLKEKTE